MLSALRFPGISVFGAFVSLCYDDCWPSFSMYFRGAGWWMWFSVAAAPLGCVTMLAPCRAATRVLWGHGQVTSQSLLRRATRGWGQPALFESLADLHLLNVLFFIECSICSGFFQFHFWGQWNTQHVFSQIHNSFWQTSDFLEGSKFHEC